MHCVCLCLMLCPQEFYNRPDTFSLGICNGCQLMALLGWVPATAAADGGVAAQLPDLQQPRFVHNTSGRYAGIIAILYYRFTPGVLSFQHLLHLLLMLTRL